MTRKPISLFALVFATILAVPVAHAVQPDASALTILDDVRSFANASGVQDDATVVFVGVNP